MNQRQIINKTAVLTFGRMNPPSLGHSVVWDCMESLAEQNDCFAFICPSHTEGTKDGKNPIPYEKKVDLIKKYVSSMSYALTSVEDLGSNPYEAIHTLEEAGATKVFFVIGSDRYSAFKDMEDNFNIDVKVVCAGKRTKNGTREEAASSTALREFAKDDDYESFRRMCPDKGKDKLLAHKAFELTQKYI